MTTTASPTALFPLFVDLRGRPVLVVGGGSVATRKIDALARKQAAVWIVARRLVPRLQASVDAGELRVLGSEFEESMLDEVWMVIAATNDAKLNARVAAAATRRRLFCNVVDDAEHSSVQMPAVVDRGALQIAISSGAAAPVLARQLREEIESSLDPALGALAELLWRWRRRIRQRLPELPVRRRLVESLRASPVMDALRCGRLQLAERRLAEQLELAQPGSPGFVALVGAGPGDPGLITLKALRRLQEADVILHDRLVTPAVLDLARRDAERIETGKEAGDHHTTQTRIHELLLHFARAGKRVVRLKGGDPFVFGRGGEEMEFLRAHGIDYEVVPGITAALACAAHAGVPLTHRDHAQSVRFVSAHCKNSLDTLDWPALAQDRQTLAVYMGVAGLAQLRDRLLCHGRSPNTPFALVENGSRTDQRVLLGDLAVLPVLAARHQIGSPALLIVGEVAALAAKLHWFGAAPIRSTAPTGREYGSEALPQTDEACA